MSKITMSTTAVRMITLRLFGADTNNLGVTSSCGTERFTIANS